VPRLRGFHTDYGNGDTRAMTDRWTSTAAGRHLSGRRKVNTEPEVALRRALHRSGARFRLHVQLAKGCTPDILLPGRRVAIFVDGCWWHSCPRHGRRTPFTGPNAHLWSEKMRRNRERDVRSTALAQGLGWTVVRVWECEVRDDAGEAAERALQAGDTGPRRH
jgi:DNA mismatch endonuclease, patch repair protein